MDQRGTIVSHVEINLVGSSKKSFALRLGVPNMFAEVTGGEVSAVCKTNEDVRHNAKQNNL